MLLFSTKLFSQSIPYGNNSSVGKYVEINGAKHYYEVYGEGPPLLVIHGNKTASKGNAPQIEYFSRKYKVYTIDCRGRGKSELGKDSLTYIQQAKDLAVFIKLMKMDSVYIIGKSDGAIIALLMGIYYPDKIKKLVCFGTNLWPDSTALYPQTVQSIHDERVSAERMLAKKDTTDNWYLVQQRNRLMEFQPHITAADLHKIKIPTLVMSCDRDVIKEEHTLFIYKNIPYSNLSILPGEVHTVSRLNPALFNTTVDTYLSRSYRDESLRFK